MRAIRISLERNGEMVPVGVIAGDTPATATFAYDDEYLKLDGSIPICLALPLRHEPFSPDETMRYFDGLLPEGFTRRCVAGAARADESDYLSILSSLGAECIGAVMAVESGVLFPKRRTTGSFQTRKCSRLPAKGQPSLLRWWSNRTYRSRAQAGKWGCTSRLLPTIGSCRRGPLRARIS